MYYDASGSSTRARTKVSLSISFYLKQVQSSSSYECRPEIITGSIRNSYNMKTKQAAAIVRQKVILTSTNKSHNQIQVSDVWSNLRWSELMGTCSFQLYHKLFLFLHLDPSLQYLPSLHFLPSRQRQLGRSITRLAMHPPLKDMIHYIILGCVSGTCVEMQDSIRDINLILTFCNPYCSCNSFHCDTSSWAWVYYDVSGFSRFHHIHQCLYH